MNSTRTRAKDGRLCRIPYAVNWSDASEATLMSLLDPRRRVRTRIETACHDSATEKVLLHALDDKDERVRSAAVDNKKATEAVLMKALDDDSDRVRIIAVGSHAATPAVLEKALSLFDHSDPEESILIPRLVSQSGSATEKLMLDVLEIIVSQIHRHAESEFRQSVFHNIHTALVDIESHPNASPKIVVRCLMLRAQMIMTRRDPIFQLAVRSLVSHEFRPVRDGVSQGE